MPSAKSHVKRTVEDHRKQPLTASLGAGEPPPPRTIVDHFAHSKQGLRKNVVDDLSASSPSKRIKLRHRLERSQEAKAGAPQVRKVMDMYTFTPGKRQSSSGMIDLTSSPSASPSTLPNGGIRRANFTSSSGPKRILVKNKKNKPSGPEPEQHYRDVWAKIEASLSAIFLNEKLLYSKETLYNEVMILCRQKKASALLAALDDRFTTHVESQLKVGLAEIARTKSDAEFLRSVVNSWSTWNQQLESVRAIFFFLDRSYILQAGLPSVKEMGVHRFRTTILEHEPLLPKILQGTCDVIGAERYDQYLSDESILLQEVVKMFTDLGVYSKHLEPKIMSESQDFYSTWAEQTVASTDLRGYLEMCDRLIKQETDRAESWAFDPATTKQLETYLEEILIEAKTGRLLNTQDIGKLLGQDEVASLRQCYVLLQRRRLGGRLKAAFEDYIVTQGSSIVFDEGREQEMVPRLLDFKQKLDLVWESAFAKNVDLGHTLREAFETFINKSKRSNMTWGTDNPKPGEMIAKYVDQVLKGGTKAVRASGISTNDLPITTEPDQDGSDEDEDTEIGKQLDQVLDLFRFVHGKAVFEAFYKRDLARRLLLGRSASSDAEKSMLTRLKSECGAGFTHNLEQMFKDIEMAREEISSYKAMFEERAERPPFDLTVNVLSSAAWPSYPDVQINMPEAILKATTNYEQYYKLKHSGRKLEWKHALAHCQLRSSFPRGAKEIVVSCFQAVILLSFNDVESKSYSELQSISGLIDVELKRTLQSLASAKYRVLTKSPKGKDVNTGDTFTINLGFRHPKYRIKINQIQARETKQENQQTHERVAADRAFETQAAIVRIMKSRKTITHPELVSEVISATKSRGPLDPADIKKNIEKLIDKDYMERDEDAHNTYSYVA